MGKVQIVLIALVVLALLVLAIATWGSIGSSLCVFLLILMTVAILYRKLVLERDEDTFDWEL